MSGAATRVARRLLEGGPTTATQLAADLGLTPAAVRRQLDALEGAGYLAVHEEAPFGPRIAEPRRRGRPAKVFALTATGRDAFDGAYNDIAVEALRFMAEHSDQPLVEAYARHRLAQFESRYAQALAAIPTERRAEALADLLSADGFAASIQDAPGGVQLCEHHCPMAHVAAEFPEFCEAEQATFSRLLGVHTVRVATMAKGADICTTIVPKGAPA